MATKLKAVSSTAQKIAQAIKDLKDKHDARGMNAVPTLQLAQTGICMISTGRMNTRSRHEIWNYAYLLNSYIKKQRGKQVKIKSTKSKRRDQGLFCGTVRKLNEKLFDELNYNLKRTDKNFSVVAHLPDECVQVRRFGESHNQVVPIGPEGMNKAPGWSPITNQANSLVAKLGNQKSKDIPVKELQVDGLTPDVFIPIKQVDDILMKLGLHTASEEGDISSEEESEDSSEEGSDSDGEEEIDDSGDE